MSAMRRRRRARLCSPRHRRSEWCWPRVRRVPGPPYRAGWRRLRARCRASRHRRRGRVNRGTRERHQWRTRVVPWGPSVHRRGGVPRSWYDRSRCRAHRQEILGNGDVPQSVGSRTGYYTRPPSKVVGALFRSEVDQDRLTTSPVTGFHIVEDVADHPRPSEVDVSSGGNLEQHPWLRLAAGAGNGQVRYGTVGVVWAEDDRAQLDPPDAQHLAQPVVHALQIVLREEATGDPRLVRDHDELPPGCLKHAEQRTDLRGENEVFRARGVVPGLDQGSVPVKEERSLHQSVSFR